jgi:hypothetical protein
MQSVTLVSEPGHIGQSESRLTPALVGRMACYSVVLGTVCAAAFGVVAFLFLLASWAYVAVSTPSAGPQSLFHFAVNALMVVAMLIMAPLLGGVLGGATGLVAAWHCPPRDAAWPFASQFFRCVWRHLWNWTLGSMAIFGATAAVGSMFVGAGAWMLLPVGALLGHGFGSWRGVTRAQQGVPSPPPIFPDVTA